ncbi:MAG TPA: hypothetical protein VGW33_06060 [Terriglobia bacterium]|nr:hypothetical protein [Terriglobia bacterium]
MTARIERVLQLYFLVALFSTSGIDGLLVLTAIFFSLECARNAWSGLAANATALLAGITTR